jgi:hypothetical protein
MKRLYLALVLSLGCYSYSYSETIFGTTGNAAEDNRNWVMTNLLPAQAGLTVGSVFYRYTTVKNTEDDMIVHVQNEDAQNKGQYVFRETDDWSGLPGNTINKLVGINDIVIDRWGDGSIEIEGEGIVTDPNVVYNYQFDPCFDPQVSVDCPGYVTPYDPDLIPDEPETVDPLDDDIVQDEIDRKATLKDEEEEEKDRKEAKSKNKKKERVSLEKVLGIVNDTIMAGEAQALHSELISLNYIPKTYFATLPDTKYEETVVLKDANLPNNKRGRRVGLAQQLLHQQMVDSQWED